MNKDNYLKLIDNAVDSIAVLQGHEIKLVNTRLVKMFGCRHKREMLDHPFTDFIAPEDREMMSRMCLESENDQTFPYHWEFKALCCGGKTGTTYFTGTL